MRSKPPSWKRTLYHNQHLVPGLSWGIGTQSPDLQRDPFVFDSDYEERVTHYRSSHHDDDDDRYATSAAAMAIHSSDFDDRRMLFIAPSQEEDNAEDNSNDYNHDNKPATLGLRERLCCRFWPSAAAVCNVPEEDAVEGETNEWNASRDKVIVFDDEDNDDKNTILRGYDICDNNHEIEEEWTMVEYEDGDDEKMQQDVEAPIEDDTASSILDNINDENGPDSRDITLLGFLGWEEDMGLDLATTASVPPSPPPIFEIGDDSEESNVKIVDNLFEFLGWDECLSFSTSSTPLDDDDENSPNQNMSSTVTVTPPPPECKPESKVEEEEEEEEHDLWAEARTQSRFETSDHYPDALFRSRRREVFHGRRVYEQKIDALRGEKWEKMEVFRRVVMAWS